MEIKTMLSGKEKQQEGKKKSTSLLINPFREVN